MKKILFPFLFGSLFTLITCSNPLEGFGVKPAGIEDVSLSGKEGSLTVTWQKIELADSYKIFLNTSQTIPAKPYAVVKETSITIPDLLNDVTYYVWVIPSNNRGEQIPKMVFSGIIPLSVPTGIRAGKTAGDTIRVSWQSVTLADEYEVFCKTNPVPPAVADTPDQTVSVNFALFSGLNQPDYYFWIKAKNSRGKSAFSGMIQDGFVVSNFKVSAITEDGIKLEWDTMNEASGYNVYRSTNENGIYSKIHTGIVSDTTFIDTDISRFTTYYYKVSVTIGSVEAVQSSPVSAVYGILVPGSGLAAKLAWLQSNVASNNIYGIEVTANEYLVPQRLSYTGKSGIVIIMSGVEVMRTITLSASGSLFTIGSDVTLILDNNITLIGRSGNMDSLVTINSHGAMVMNTGSKITGNSNTSAFARGGGVLVAGTFTMNGGEISGNTLSPDGSWGGGVFVNGIFTMNDGKISGNSINSTGSTSGGGGVCVFEGVFYMNGGEISANSVSAVSATRFVAPPSSANTTYGGGVYVYSRNISPAISIGFFVMSGGVIYGSNAATSLRNTANTNGTALYKDGLAQYGTYSGNTFYKSGDLTTTNNTIRVVNGNLQTN
jgi:fibronectin type 3 domain-containing protein